uniref:Uncharacterized protein n=1 Tax=Vitis vinifera TaxID=29760 RepID=F6HDG7_VITVI
MGNALELTRGLVERSLSSCAVLNAGYKRPISQREIEVLLGNVDFQQHVVRICSL